MSKLALLDGNGLNELARRAGVTQQLFQPGETTNIMLGLFRSMTQSFQWMGEIVDADTGSIGTTFGICGSESGGELKKKDWCGVQGGFVLWRNPEAREKVFRVIFKGYGPGPGSTSLADMGADLPAAAIGVPDAARVLRLGADQTDYMREIVVVMQGKIPGVATVAAVVSPRPQPAPAPAPARPGAGVPPRTPPAPAPAVPAGAAPPQVISNWGQRCCAKDIAELRAALIQMQRASQGLQGGALQQLGRRTTGGQIATLLSQLNAALDTFGNTRDAATATAALANISRGLDLLARVVTGT
jgi:hypothetical protein